MAKIQTWTIPMNDEVFHVTLTRRTFSRTVTMEINGETFKLEKGKREEPFRLGDEQAILYMESNGYAKIRLQKGFAEEDLT